MRKEKNIAFNPFLILKKIMRYILLLLSTYCYNQIYINDSTRLYIGADTYISLENQATLTIGNPQNFASEKYNEIDSIGFGKQTHLYKKELSKQKNKIAKKNFLKKEKIEAFKASFYWNCPINNKTISLQDRNNLITTANNGSNFKLNKILKESQNTFSFSSIKYNCIFESTYSETVNIFFFESVFSRPPPFC